MTVYKLYRLIEMEHDATELELVGEYPSMAPALQELVTRAQRPSTQPWSLQGWRLDACNVEGKDYTILHGCFDQHSGEDFLKDSLLGEPD